MKKRAVRTPRSKIKIPSSGLIVWEPEIVLSSSIEAAERSAVRVAEPVERPAAIANGVHAARSVLDAFASARDTLGSRVAAARARERQALSEQQRVAAVMETYRAEARLADVLTGTLKHVTAMMEERGLR